MFTAIGELVGFAAPAVVMAAGTVGGWSDTVQMVAAVLVGAVEGAALGLAQWLALRHALPTLSRTAWVLPTAVGAMVACLLAMLAVALGPIVQQQVALLAMLAVVLGVASWCRSACPSGWCCGSISNTLAGGLGPTPWPGR